MSRWQDKAECLDWDQEDFYPDDAGHKGGYRQARIICNACAVQPECAAYALARREPHGMWGGMTPPERFALLAKLDEAFAVREVTLAAREAA